MEAAWTNMGNYAILLKYEYIESEDTGPIHIYLKLLVYEIVHQNWKGGCKRANMEWHPSGRKFFKTYSHQR